MAIDERIQSDLLIHPGEELADTLAALGLSQNDLALRSGISRKHINRIVRGKELISPKVALLFERVLRTPATFWINLSQNYELDLTRQQCDSQLESQVARLNTFPIKDMIQHGWIKDSKSPAEQARGVLSFFRVASFEILDSVWKSRFAAAYRKTDGKPASREALAVWIQAGRNQAAKIKTSAFSEEALRLSIDKLRQLTRDPNTFIPKSAKLLSEAGVTLVMVPHPKGTYANGATYWLESDRPVVQLSIRFKWVDIIIFTLFHELGHILRKHPHSRIYVENNHTDKKELEANHFAAEALIPSHEYSQFRRNTPVNRNSIIEFASEMEIHPSVVAGRILRETKEWGNPLLNSFRPKYEWTEK